MPRRGGTAAQPATSVPAPAIISSSAPKSRPRFFSDATPTREHRPKRVCMLTHSVFETDNRVNRYASALADRGDEVDVLALKRDARLPDVETLGKVRLHRLMPRGRKDPVGFGGFGIDLDNSGFHGTQTLDT